MNCLANEVPQTYLQNIFIPYCPGDNGGAIGSALSYNKKLSLKVSKSYLNKKK